MANVTMRLDEIVEEINADPGLFQHGRKLTAGQKDVVKPEDLWEVAFVNDIPDRTFKAVDAAFAVNKKYLGEYVRYQRLEWMSKQKYLLGTRLGREPSNLDLLEDPEHCKNTRRYKLCYLLEHPERVIVDVALYSKYEGDIEWFLAGASKLDPKGRDYFGIILGNVASGAKEE